MQRGGRQSFGARPPYHPGPQQFQPLQVRHSSHRNCAMRSPRYISALPYCRKGLLWHCQSLRGQQALCRSSSCGHCPLHSEAEGHRKTPYIWIDVYRSMTSVCCAARDGRPRRPGAHTSCHTATHRCPSCPACRLPCRSSSRPASVAGARPLLGPQPSAGRHPGMASSMSVAQRQACARLRMAEEQSACAGQEPLGSQAGGPGRAASPAEGAAGALMQGRPAAEEEGQASRCMLCLLPSALRPNCTPCHACMPNC
jgi:hypothetical protein